MTTKPPKTSDFVYTGIGSRSTPPQMLTTMIRIGQILNRECWWLRSGSAPGADTAFETGAGRCHEEPQKHIFIPWPTYENRHLEHDYLIIPLDVLENEVQERCFRIAAGIHPAWSTLSEGAKKLHARNVLQILGQNAHEDGGDVTDALICWTPHAEPVGGSRTAIILAQRYNVPIFNLADLSDRPKLVDWFDRHHGISLGSAFAP